MGERQKVFLLFLVGFCFKSDAWGEWTQFSPICLIVNEDFTEMPTTVFSVLNSIPPIFCYLKYLRAKLETLP